MAPCQLQQRQRDRLGPQLLVPGHGRAAVQAHHHGPLAFFLHAPESVLQDLVLQQAALKVPMQQRVAQRHQLLRQQALQGASLLHRVKLLVGPLEGALAQRQGVGLHPAHHADEFPELVVARQPPAQLKPPVRGEASPGAQGGAPALGFLRGLVELLSGANGGHPDPRPGFVLDALQILGQLTLLLPDGGGLASEPALEPLRDLRQGFLLAGGVLLLAHLVRVLQHLPGLPELLLLLTQLPGVHHVVAGPGLLRLEHGQKPLADEQRAQAGPGLVEQGELPQDPTHFAVVQRGQEGSIDGRAGQNVRFVGEDDIVFEQQAEDVLQQRGKVGDEGLAGLLQLLQGGGVPAKLRVGVPVVAIVLDPVGVLGQIGRRSGLPGGHLPRRPRGHYKPSSRRF